jgi:hypothetical protein
MRSAAAFGELADFVRARKGCEIDGQRVRGLPRIRHGNLPREH